MLSVAACGGSDGGPTNTTITASSDTDATANAVLENAPIGTPVGITISANDPDQGDTVEYSLADDASGLFSIDRQSGVVLVAGNLDFETEPTHQIVARSASSDGSSTQITLTIDVTDDASPVIAVGYPPDFGRLEGDSFTMRGTVSDPEGTAVRVEVVTDGQVVTAAIHGGEWFLPDVRTGSGAISLVATDAKGETTKLAKQYDVRLSLLEPVGLAATRDGSWLILDRARQSLLALDPASGDLTIASGEGLGMGPDIKKPSALAVSPVDGIAYVANHEADQILSVNPSTGDRRLLTNLPGCRPIDLEYDSGDNSLITLCDTGTGSFTYRINLVDGTAESTPGSRLADSRAVTPDNVHNQLIYVLEAFPGDDHGSLVELHLTTGELTSLPDVGFIASDAIRLGTDIAVVGENIYVVDRETDALVRVDAATGVRTIVSGPLQGNGRSLRLANALHVTSDETNAHVVDPGLKAILSIDLATGDRTVLHDSSLGSEAGWVRSTALVYDPTNQRLYATDYEAKLLERASAVYQIDLVTGIRTTLSGFDVGTGPELERAGTLAFSDLGTLFTVESEHERLLEINTSGGARTVISDEVMGTGTNLLTATFDLEVNADGTAVYALIQVPLNFDVQVIDVASGDRSSVAELHNLARGTFGFALDEDNNRLITASRTAQVIQAVDLTTNAITYISGASLFPRGSGPGFEEPIDVFYSAHSPELFVSDRLVGVFAVDASTGDRTIVAHRSGPGTPIGDPYRTLARDDHSAFVLSTAGSVYVVDLETGHRVLISN